MKWGKRIALGCGGLLLVAIAAVIGLWIWQPWVPPLVMADPGPTGKRVTIGGRPANYFPVAGAGRRPALLVLGGSEGGLGTGGAQNARALQAAGYSALQFSYFRAPGQPAELVRIPIESFNAALAWLKSRPEVDPTRIGVVGVSKGAEAALLLASHNPEIDVVVAGTPSSVIWPGFSWSGSQVSGSSWTVRGRDVPALPFGRADGFMDVGSLYGNGLKAAAARPRSAIEIEKANAKVLLVCGEADALWPACPMARQLKRRAPGKVSVVAYPAAGHGVFGAPAGPSKKTGPASFGGTIEGNRAARKDSWKLTLHFLDQAFAQ